MTQVFNASGWIPRSQGEAAGAQQLLRWITGNANWDRRCMPPSPWTYTTSQTPLRTGIGNPAFDCGIVNRDVEQKLFNYMQIPVLPGPLTTKGYVTCRSIYETRDLTRRGQLGGTMNPIMPEQTRSYKVWDVIRCLPSTDQEALDWGYTRENDRQWQVILSESRRYNATIRERLMRGYSAGRAHSTSINDMQRQSQDLMFQAAFQLATAVGSSSAMNYVPSVGDFAAAAYAPHI